MSVKQHEEFVRQYCKVQSWTGDEANILCPAHDDRNSSCRVNVTKGLWFCHGCHTGGGMKRLAQLLGVRYSYDTTDAAMGLMMSKIARLKEAQGNEVPSFLPESTLDAYRVVPCSYLTDPLPRGRGLTQDTIDMFDIGYDPMVECVTFPARDRHGRLLGVTKRYLSKNSPLKYRDPKGFQKAHHLFGAHLASVHESGQVVVVEGLFDCAKVWQAGHVSCAQYGSYLTVEQIKVLKRIGTVSIVLMYDNDEGGKLSRRHALGFEKKKIMGKEVTIYNPDHDLRRHFIVRIAQYPYGVTSNKMDPGGMSDMQIDRSIRQSRLVR